MITTIDQLWFQSHPDRDYRLRRQTPAEIAGWAVQPAPNFIAWCIVRREPARTEVFAAPWTDFPPIDDHDLELKGFFNEIANLNEGDETAQGDRA